jgi:hypothetical protein
VEFIAAFCGAVCGTLLLGGLFYIFVKTYLTKLGQMLESHTMPRMLFDSVGPLFPIVERDFYVDPEKSGVEAIATIDDFETTEQETTI